MRPRASMMPSGYSASTGSPAPTSADRRAWSSGVPLSLLGRLSFGRPRLRHVVAIFAPSSELFVDLEPHGPALGPFDQPERTLGGHGAVDHFEIALHRDANADHLVPGEFAEFADGLVGAQRLGGRHIHHNGPNSLHSERPLRVS